MLKISLLFIFLFNFSIAQDNDFKKEKDIICYNYYKEIPDSIKSLPFKIFAVSLDKYTRVLYKEQVGIYNDYMLNRWNATLGITFDSTSRGFEIYSVYQESDAYESGLERGDILVSIDGKQPKNADELEQLAKGRVNSIANIVVKRDDDTIDINILRRDYVFDNVYSQKLYNTAIIKIESFHAFVSMEFFVNSSILEPSSIDTLIIDLRGNSGGLLRDCLDIADEFIDDDVLILSRASRKDTIRDFSRKGGKWIGDKVIIVLQDSVSASASEVLSSILKEYKGAVVVGDTSYGKGLVQVVIDYEDKVFIVTSSEYFTMGKNKIHGIGVIPDKSLKDIKLEKLPKNFKLKEFREKYPHPSLEALRDPLLKGQKNISHLIWEKDGELFEILLQKPYN